MPFFRRKRSRERAAEMPAEPVAVAAEPIVAEAVPVVVPVAPVATAASATGTTASRPAPAEVRSWAKANGLMVNDRGRLPASVYSAYEAARASAA